MNYGTWSKNGVEVLAIQEIVSHRSCFQFAFRNAIPLVYSLAGLCLPGFGGVPCISHKIVARKPYFHIFNFFSENN